MTTEDDLINSLVIEYQTNHVVIQKGDFFVEDFMKKAGLSSRKAAQNFLAQIIAKGRLVKLRTVVNGRMNNVYRPVKKSDTITTD